MSLYFWTCSFHSLHGSFHLCVMVWAVTIWKCCEKCHMTAIKGNSHLNVLYEYIKKMYLTDVKFPAWTFNSGKITISEHIILFLSLRVFAAFLNMFFFFLSLHYSFCLHAMVWGATMVNMVRKIIGQHKKKNSIELC